MGHFTEQTTVSAPPESTFAYITDQSRLSEWNDHVERAEVVGGEPATVGSVLLQHRRRNNRAFTLTFTVTAHEPPTHHVVTGSVFGVDTTMGFDVLEAPGGSRVTMTADVVGRGWRGLLAPAVTREMRKSTVSALAALRTRLG